MVAALVDEGETVMEMVRLQSWRHLLFTRHNQQRSTIGNEIIFPFDPLQRNVEIRVSRARYVHRFLRFFIQCFAMQKKLESGIPHGGCIPRNKSLDNDGRAN